MQPKRRFNRGPHFTLWSEVRGFTLIGVLVSLLAWVAWRGALLILHLVQWATRIRP